MNERLEILDYEDRKLLGRLRFLIGWFAEHNKHVDTSEEEHLGAVGLLEDVAERLEDRFVKMEEAIIESLPSREPADLGDLDLGKEG